VSPDGDIFATGVTTSTTFVGALTGNVTGNISGGTVAGSTGTFTGDVDIADKIVHTGDTDTAIRFPSADTFSVETAGSERFRFTSDGTIHVNSSDSASGGRIYATGSALYLQSGNGRQTLKVSDAAAGVNRTIEMTSAGNLAFPSGNGIDFSATADTSATGASASSELFDDYEEGSWTPYIDRENGSPIIAYDAQDGYYTKIGRVVYFYSEVRINSYNGNGSYGLTHLRGLPYTSAARTGGRGVWNSVTYHSYYRDMTTTDGEKDIAVVQGSSEKVVFYIQRSENSWATPPAPDANDQFKIGGFYFA
jgi:hypothetical protein